MARNQDAGPLPSPMVGGDDVIAQIQALVGPHSFDYEGPAAVADPMLKAGLDNSPIYHPLGVGGRVAQTVAGAIMARKAAEMHSKSAQGQAAANAALEQAKMKQTLALKQYEEGEQNKRQDKQIAETAKDRAAQRELTSAQRQETERHNKQDESFRQQELDLNRRRYGPSVLSQPDEAQPAPKEPSKDDDPFAPDTKPGKQSKNIPSGAQREQMQVQPTGHRGMFNAPPEGTVKGSWFGQYRGWHDPDSGTQTASGISLNEPGIALPSRKTLGQWFDVTAPNGKTMRVRQTDLGPAKWTGRGVDITASLADKFGYKPNNFPTDEGFRVTPASGPGGFQMAGEERPVPKGIVGSPPSPRARPDDMGPGVTPRSRPPMGPGLQNQHVPNNDPRALKALYGDGYGPPIVSPKAIAADQGKPGNSPGIHIAQGPNGEKLPIEYHPQNPSLQRLGNVQTISDETQPPNAQERRLLGGNEKDRELGGQMYRERIQRENAGHQRYLEEEGTTLAKERATIDRTASSATDELPQLQLLGKLIKDPNFYSGWRADDFARMSAAAKALGISQGRVATLLQFATKLGAAGSLENIQEMAQSGAVRVPEMNMIRDSNFSKDLTPEANAAVVDLRMRLAQRRIEVANAAQHWADNHGGQIDRKFYQKVREHYKDKPLISDDEIDHYNEMIYPKDKKSDTKSDSEGWHQGEGFRIRPKQ